jgi:hypothetical protein
LCAIGVNRAQFAARGFGAVLEDLVASAGIVGLRREAAQGGGEDPCPARA